MVLVPPVADFHLEVEVIFSRKSLAKTLSISAKQFATSLSQSAKFIGLADMTLSVEKKPYRSCKLVICWQVSTRCVPFLFSDFCRKNEEETISDYSSL